MTIGILVDKSNNFEMRVMEFIPDWRTKNLKCHFCGETRSVKYKTKILEVNNSKFNNKVKREVYVCNKCILTITGIQNDFEGVIKMKSIQCGCKFCNDMRNIQPASYIYIGGGNKNFQEFIEKAREEKKFIVSLDGYFDKVTTIDKCPYCGYVFTEEDYDSYN